MGSLNSRVLKVEWLKNSIEAFFQQKPLETISKKKLLAVFALENNTTKRTGQEILSLLNDSGFIKIDGDIIRK